ncbi:hypothetical protein LJC64_01265 [Ruminococcaceae bacterium OttesenSCG-928-A11]|nr:hypothetical protein [Ruminococcaceae bacterium OttesenSCG-928-A11]
MNKILLAAGGIVCVAAVAMFGPRFYHNYQRKRATQNTFAIQNIETGMNLRPYNAGIADDVKIIQYPHNEWECLTWQMIRMEDESYLLKNLYTHKTFQPVTAPGEGIALHQRTLEANQYQYWEFIKQADETYAIRLKKTDLYLTTANDDKDSAIILMPPNDLDNQKWRLIEQHPVI